MRTILNFISTSHSDGVIKDPQDVPSLGKFPYQGSQIQAALLQRCDAVLMGRDTYEGFAPVWSARSGRPAE